MSGNKTTVINQAENRVTAALELRVGDVTQRYETSLPFDRTRTTSELADEAWRIVKEQHKKDLDETSEDETS